jgi:hypothetical protein
MTTPTPVLAALARPWLAAFQRTALPVLVGLALAGGSFRALAATAAPPNLMTYQGYLVDANGAPLAPTTPANYPVTFRIYDASQAGALIWTEQQIVTVDKGNFSVLLGEGSAVGAELRPPLSNVFGGAANAASASDRFIDITVTIGGSPVLIAPRLRLVPAPYAFLAASANNLVQPNGSTVVSYAGGQVTVAGNLAASGTLSATGKISGDGSGLTLTAAQIPNLDAGKLGTGTLDPARIPATLTGNRAFTGGYVGIGTATPASRLHVKDDTLPTAIFESSHPAGTWLSLGNSTVAGRFWQLIMTGSGNGNGNLLLTTGPLANQTSATPMEWRPNGDVRWGSGALLRNDQGGSIELGNSVAAGSVPFLDFHYGKGVDQDYNVRLINDADGQLSLAGVMRFSGGAKVDGGNVMEFGAGVAGKEGSAGKIGYQTFSDGLDIVGAGPASGGSGRKVKIWAEGGATFNGSSSQGITVLNGGLFFRMYRNSDGLILEGNNMRNQDNIPSAGFGRAIWDGDGNLDAYSDRRLKKDISDAEPVLDRLMQVQVRRYHWTNQLSSQPKAFGVIAQEVQPLFPDLVRSVSRSEEGGEKVFTMKYGAFGLIAAKAVQELKAEKDAERSAFEREIGELKHEVELLKGQLAKDARVENMQRELDSLKQMVRELAAARTETAVPAIQAADASPSAAASARLVAAATETIGAR